jgi:hypothetical protein
MGVNVWDHARTLFSQREGMPNLPTPISGTIGDINYDGTPRRESIAPTSK